MAIRRLLVTLATDHAGRVRTMKGRRALHMQAMGTRVPQGSQQVNDYKIQCPLEIVILNEVSQTEKDTYHMISLICGI